MLNPSLSKNRIDRAYRELRSRILSGALPPGAKLRAEELAPSLSMSPTPVREALQRLVADGLVEYTPQKGAQVASVSLTEMFAVYQLRMTLEPAALLLSMRRADAAWALGVRDSYKALASMEHPGERWDEEFERSHADLHVQMLAACDARSLLIEVERLRALSLMYLAGSGAPHGSVEDHLLIVEAALEGTHETAVHLLVEHIGGVVEALRLGGDAVLSAEQGRAAEAAAKLIAGAWHKVEVRAREVPACTPTS